MGQALYRKYRSKNLGEIVGQDHITKTLDSAVKSGRVSHAYLFTGPRGVGKTSIARILAYLINDLDYNEKSNDIDIIEIDAASNRRIDEIREIRDKVYIAPTASKYKVYIIDEAHMLTREAFNALLKTLEEPPEHAVFILATTEAHKLPDTIVSRTQRYNFRPIPEELLEQHLAEIAKKEGIKVDKDAISLLAKYGAGSFRDSISLLDQASSRSDKLTADAVRDMLGIPPDELVDKLSRAATAAASKTEIVQELNQALLEGYQPQILAKLLVERSTIDLINARDDRTTNELAEFVSRLIEVPASADPKTSLKLCLLANASANTESPPEPSVQVTEEPVPVEIAEPVVEVAAQEDPVKPKKSVKKAGKLTLDAWPEVLLVLKKNHNTLYGVARMAEPSIVDDDTLRLSVAFAFHQKRLNESSNRQRISDIFEQVTSHNVQVEVVLDKSAQPNSQPIIVDQEAQKPDMTAISNIFGGGELIES